MADESEVVVETPVVEETPAVVAEVQPEPHPLEPGGKRFQEVYGDWRAEQAARQRAEAELSALRTQFQQVQQPPAQQQFTPEQIANYLQQQIDQGQITPMQAANALSTYNAQRVATTTALQVEQARTQATRLQAAGAEVNQFIARIPALMDTSSQDFLKVRDAAISASEDMNLPVSDMRVQRRALREVYGSLEKVAVAHGNREESRRASLPHVETPGGGRGAAPAPKADESWKKDVPAAYLEHWKRRNYTEEQMKEEAKYVVKTPRTYAK